MKIATLCVLLATPLMAAYVNSANGGTCGGGSTTCTMSLAVTAGNFVVVEANSSTNGASPINCSDGVNTYAAVAGSPWNLNGTAGPGSSYASVVAIFTFTALTTTTLTINCVNQDSQHWNSSVAVQYAGTSIAIDKVAALSVAATLSNMQTTWFTGTTSTTSTASELLVAIFANSFPTGPSGAEMIDATYTARENYINGVTSTVLSLIADKFVNATGAYQASMTQGAASSFQFGTNVIITLTGVSGNPVPPSTLGQFPRVQ